MKKLFLFGALAFLGTAALTSCKKDYQCDYGGGDVVNFSKLGKTQASANETTCALSGGVWSKK